MEEREHVRREKRGGDVEKKGLDKNCRNKLRNCTHPEIAEARLEKKEKVEVMILDWKKKIDRKTLEPSGITGKLHRVLVKSSSDHDIRTLLTCQMPP